MLGGAGTLLGPPINAQFSRVIEFLKTYLPQFAESILKTDIHNENGLNSRLSYFITNTAIVNQENFFAHRENMEDETRGNSPATDIGIYLKADDIGIDPPLITVLEGKRLSSKMPNQRRREYVIGHEKDGKHVQCGGIERFKLSIHGRMLNCAGMIGYLQDGTPVGWQKKISGWIRDLCNQALQPEWLEWEQLKLRKTDGRVTELSSIVKRVGSELYLTHLWIDLRTTGEVMDKTTDL